MIFYNNFEFLFPEFFLITFLLIILLFGIFYNNNIIIKNINSITIYLLICLLILFLYTPDFININLMNGIIIINNFTQFIKIILIISCIILLLIHKKYLLQQIIISYEIIILILISLLGLIILVSSNHFITLYLSIELQSLSFYILTASQKKSLFSIEASLKYFILSFLASIFILLGCSIIYFLTGSLNFNNIFLIISNINFLENINLLISFIYTIIFIIVGILFKIGAAPFHIWLPDIYEGAPNNITTFFATVPLIGFISILIRFFFDIFFFLSFFYETFFLIISFLSMLIGSLLALYQNKIKRLLAYSSITHIGFILIGFTSNLLNNIIYILLYTIIYIIMNINLWIIYLSLNIFNKPIKYLTDLSNLYKLNKLISLIILINIFSLIGIPPIAGFFSKFFIFLSAFKSNYFNLIFIAIFFNILSSFYYLKLIKIICFEKKKINKILNNITKIQTILLLINTQIILFIYLFFNIILIYLNKIYLNFLI